MSLSLCVKTYFLQINFSYFNLYLYQYFYIVIYYMKKTKKSKYKIKKVKGGANGEDGASGADNPIETMKLMGFNNTTAIAALTKFNGNVEQATLHLLEQAGAEAVPVVNFCAELQQGLQAAAGGRREEAVYVLSRQISCKFLA